MTFGSGWPFPSGPAPYIRSSPSATMWPISYPYAGSYATTAGFVSASVSEWPSACCRPSPVSVVRPAVAPIRKPRAIWSPAAHRASPVRWNPNIE